tara:strand:- start:13494 stop:14813 length:1320 start_codon:yes stop_codon:yes gene_type:complete
MLTDLEFKKQQLDTKSASFCGAKWGNATIWLGSGMTTSCHHPLPHKINLLAVQTNPKLLHNTPEKKEQRRQMQCGERPSGCEYCWKIEDMGPEYVSDRVYKSNIYSKEELQEFYETPSEDDVNLRTLEIAFDRTCNFACSYCNPAFSTTWVKDIKNNGGYQGLVSDGRNHFTHTHEENQLFKLNEYNPYVEAFFKWWDSDLHRTLKELRITGGEPIMSPELWRLFEWFKKNVDKSKTKLAINSNLGGKPELIDKLVEAKQHVPTLDVYTSCESTGVKAEYIRDGLDFSHWWGNLVRLHQAGINTHCMMTVNALCLDTLPDLIFKILYARLELDKNFAVFSLNILRFPSFQSCLVLPQYVKNTCAGRLKSILLWDLHDFERGQVERLIEYLRTVEKPHNESFEMPKLHNDFKQFYQQYDVRRNKNFETTFPELSAWYQKL